MTERGLMQSELAVRAARYMADKKFGRDLISFYVRAKSLPSPTHLAAIARALGVEPKDLLPFQGIPGADNSAIATFDVKDAGDGQNAWLRINRLVTWEQAQIVLKALNAPKT